MKVLFLAALALAFASASSLPNRHERSAAPRVLQFDTQRRHVEDPVARDRRRLRRRGDTFQADLTNDKTLYYLNATLGTPAQDVRLHIDTGSSDLWVNTPASQLCSSRRSPCAGDGTFSAQDSSTYTFLNSDFNITYADGSSSAGDYGSDTLRIEGVAVDGMQFGLGLDSSTPDNILGIGYVANEAILSTSDLGPYPNLPARLQKDGVIAANAYSLWLNDLDASTGSVLFGGVDSDRYQGDLVTFPIQKIQGHYYEFFVTLTGFGFDGNELGSNMALAVLLDSGSSLSYLPDDIVKQVYDTVDVSFDAQSGTPFVDCALRQQNANMTFVFGDLSISVPMDEMVINNSVGPGQLTFQDGTPACLFGLAPSGGSTNVLGDTFLRSAYVVYDLDSDEISLAQTRFNVKSKTTDVGEITQDQGVPGATTAQDPQAAKSGLPGQRSQSGTIGGGSGSPDEEDAAGLARPPSARGVLALASAILALSFGGFLV